MRKHQEITDPSSCLNKARSDEMLFVLLGRDCAAAHAVRAWIEERIRLGKNNREDTKIIEAEQWIVTVLAEQDASRRWAIAFGLTPPPFSELQD